MVGELVYNHTGCMVTCYNNEGNFVELEPSTDEPIPDYEPVRIIPCSIASYVRNDPEENTHHVLDA